MLFMTAFVAVECSSANGAGYEAFPWQTKSGIEDSGMPSAAKKIFDEALSLPTDARVDLVEKLLISLNSPTRAQIDRLWAEEAERRIEEIDRGKVKMVSGKRVFADIRKKYSR